MPIAGAQQDTRISAGLLSDRCGACALSIPNGWDGRETLITNAKVSSGYPAMLVVDHILTLRAGGRNVIANLQTLCETCDKLRLQEDNAATRDHMARLP